MKGAYVLEYQVILQGGDVPIVHRETYNLTAETGGFSHRPDLESMKLSPGKYELRVSMTPPTGKVVQGSYMQHTEVRKREMRLSLKSDRRAYKPGDIITLTGTVTNISGADIDFKAMKAPEIVLKDQYQDTLGLDDVRLPDTLRREGTFRLFTLRFTAGKEDKRFTMGVRREALRLPFARPGDYNFKLTMRVPTGEVVKPAWKHSVRPWLQALPSTTKLRIAPEKR